MSRLMFDVDPSMPQDQKEVLETALALVVKGGYDVPTAADEMKALTRAVKVMIFEVRMREVRRSLTTGPYANGNVVMTMSVGLMRKCLESHHRNHATADMFEDFNRECDRIGTPEMKLLRDHEAQKEEDCQ